MAECSIGFSGLHFPYSNAYKTEMNIALESLEISGNRITSIFLTRLTHLWHVTLNQHSHGRRSAY